MAEDNELRLVKLEKDIERLVSREELLKAIGSLKEDVTSLRFSQEKLNSDMSDLAKEVKEVGQAVKDVLRATSDKIQAEKEKLDAEALSRAQSQSFWNVTKIFFQVMGGIIGTATFLGLVYAVIRWAGQN